MQSIIHKNSSSMFVRYACIALSALMLAACGGGGGSPGAINGGSGGGSTGGGTGGGSGGGSTSGPTLSLTLTDGAGAAITTLSGAQTGTLRATVKTASGALVPNTVVDFKPDHQQLVNITPESALTDANGVAVVNVKPFSTSASGALAIVATAVVNSQTATGSAGVQVGAAPLTLGTLSFSPAPAAALPAFSTIQLNIPVTSGGQPATSISGLVMSSLCVGDGTATLVQGSLANGVLTATYTNNGCLRGTDTVTAAIGSSSQTINVAVTPASIGAINFVGSNLSGSSIVLKGSGGLGRSESAQLTFRVVDQHNTGLAGVDVDFRATTTTGGLLVTPTRATTDASGNVSTTISSGTIPTPVRVIAEASRNGTTISGLSDTLTISTGLPIQKSMSMSSDSYNIEGLAFDSTEGHITVLMADQYGNPVSDGTAINFVTEGGSVGSSAQGACQTINGGCTVPLRSQEFRPINGRVTVTAYAQGIEDFTDANGDGQYSCANPVDANGNAVAQKDYRPLIDICPVGSGESFSDLGDAFLDAGSLAPTSGVRSGSTLDNVYTASNGDLPIPYNHATYTSAGDNHWGINYIRRSIEVTFSGSYPTLVRQVCDAAGVCRDWTAADGNQLVVNGLAGPGCAAQTVAFRIFDINNNPLPSGTKLFISESTKVVPGLIYPDKVPSTFAIGGTIHRMTILPDNGCSAGAFTFTVSTPKEIKTGFTFTTQ